mmetsp:Transcript_3605/g.16519  ORF Transcript_3605/g.16519 Transcript_3605/m.16519 type:complete len:504 (-) Transcript_3605:3280-4791(-)
MDSSSGVRLNGSVPSPVSRCRLIVSLSTTTPLPGSVTGSDMKLCMIGSTNSSGTSVSSSALRRRSMSPRVSRTRRTTSRSSITASSRPVKDPKCVSQSKAQTYSSCEMLFSPAPAASSSATVSETSSTPKSSPRPSTHAMAAISRFRMIPAMGARMGAREILSATKTGSFMLSACSNSLASEPAPHVCPRTKSKISTSRFMRMDAWLSRNAAGSSRVRNSSTRSSVALSSSITVHFRWRFLAAAARCRMSSISFSATPNSVIVQLRVLNTRSRNLSSNLGSSRNVSTMSARNRGLELSTDVAMARARVASGDAPNSGPSVVAMFSSVRCESSPGVSTVSTCLVALIAESTFVALSSYCPNPTPLHRRRSMLDTGIQNLLSNDRSSAGTISRRASSLASNTATYSLYCRSTDTLCSITSRTSGFTTRSSAKCRTKSLTTPCSPGLAAARAGATGANGGSPRRSAWKESMRTSRWYAGMCWRSAPFRVSTPGTRPSSTVIGTRPS